MGVHRGTIDSAVAKPPRGSLSTLVITISGKISTSIRGMTKFCVSLTSLHAAPTAAKSAP